MPATLSEGRGGAKTIPREARPDALRVGLALCERSGWTLRFQAVHAMAFVAHALALRRRGQGLCRDRFMATDFGPRAPSLERLTRCQGTDPIRDPDRPLLPFLKRRGREPLSAADQAIVAGAYEALRDLSPGGLVALTHAEGGPWARHYLAGFAVPISDASIEGWELMRDAVR